MKTIADARRANREYAKRTGRAYWFGPNEMRFFNTRIHGARLVGGRYFITSERPGEGYNWSYHVVEVFPTGQVGTAGEHWPGYPTLAQAKAAMKRLAVEE